MRILIAFIYFISLYSYQKDKIEKVDPLLQAIIMIPKSRVLRSADLVNDLKSRDRKDYLKQEEEKKKLENVWIFK